MHGTTTSQEIFEKVEQLLHEYGIDLSKYACLSADGAANSVGKYNGVGAKIRAEITALYQNSSFPHFHCIIHQQNLCSKVLKLDNVLKLVTKAVNYIRGHALNQRQFNLLLEESANQFTNLPFYTQSTDVHNVFVSIFYDRCYSFYYILSVPLMVMCTCGPMVRHT